MSCKTLSLYCHASEKTINPLLIRDVALEFALESFITPVKDLEVMERRRTAEPVLWILQPARLNKAVYRSFYQDYDLIRKALGEGIDKELVERIGIGLKKESQSGIYFNIKDGHEKNMNAMIGLSSLEIIRNAFKGRELEALKSFEMNPFFYLLLRYYSDGIPVGMEKIPPLAIIHPYHSQRIKIQKGVFTVFLYYIPDDQMGEIKEINKEYPSIGMEYMKKCIPCLHSIQLTNPQRIAKELILTGAKRGNLYPDMQIISQDMENVVS